MHIVIVIPVFNDWKSFNQLIVELDAVEIVGNLQISILAVDDGSYETPEVNLPLAPFKRIIEIQIISLACNVGHQRAIAVGLSEAIQHKKYDSVIVMDSDGEDRPDDIPRLISSSNTNPHSIVCAARNHRPGLSIFRIWYECYKLIFQLLTGARIDFGNFCLIPSSRINAIVSTPASWNNLAAAITRSRIPLTRIPSDRGTRYVGKSTMNFVSLVMHGLSAIAVYIDVVMVRLMIVSTVLSVITFACIAIVVVIKFMTTVAIPGWATTAVGLLSIILLQAVLLFSISAFSALNNRSAKATIPRIDALDFIASRQRLYPKTSCLAAQ